MDGSLQHVVLRGPDVPTSLQFSLPYSVGDAKSWPTAESSFAAIPFSTRALRILLLHVSNTEEKWEIAIRACALFLGGFIVLASQFSGLNFSQFIVKSLSGLKPVTI